MGPRLAFSPSIYDSMMKARPGRVDDEDDERGVAAPDGAALAARDDERGRELVVRVHDVVRGDSDVMSEFLLTDDCEDAREVCEASEPGVGAIVGEVGHACSTSPDAACAVLFAVGDGSWQFPPSSGEELVRDARCGDARETGSGMWAAAGDDDEGDAPERSDAASTTDDGTHDMRVLNGGGDGDAITIVGDARDKSSWCPSIGRLSGGR